MSSVTPMVSVVITCYNYGAYVFFCLESVFAQTFMDYEIILVDDGSTDDSAQQIEPFLQDTRLRYIRQKNGGQANAKNRGIKESKGAFIAFLDADDLWREDKLEKQLPLFENEKVGVVYSRQRFIDHEGEDAGYPPFRKTLLPKTGKVTAELFMDNFVPFSSSVVRKKCFENFGSFDESIAMGIDWDLWLRLSTGWQFEYVDEHLLLYRIGHPGQMSKNATKRHECSDRIMAKFRKNYPEEVSPPLLKEAMAFTYCNRGIYFSPYDLSLSCKYYLQALQLKPFQKTAYVGILKNCLKSLLRLTK